jgi:L-alanine-DL-glutamate epimerase-like enolase superfamily enzyme
MPHIASFDIRCFRYPLKQPMKTVFGTVTSRPALILILTDDEGARGYGEIWCNFPQPGAEYRAALAALVLPAALSGLAVADAPRAFTKTRARLHHLSLQAGEPGPADQIACGVDIALHDLAARRASVPLATFLGGAPRVLPAYASGIDAREAEDAVAAARARGYRAFKLRIGFRGHDPVGAVALARRVMGEGDALMLDANQAWGVEEARAAAEALSGQPIAWLEEPLPVDRSAGEWRAVARAAGKIPIAGGENMRSAAEFEAAIGGNVFRVIQPDICKWGGLSECARIARAVSAAGKLYCPHYLGGGIGLAASAHLLAAAGGAGLLEVDCNDNALREILAAPLLTLKDGAMKVPEGPGLGYEPDLAGVREYQVSRHTGAVEGLPSS